MSHDVMIVEVVLPESQCVLLQSLLQGEDGLATVRCFDPEKKKQQFWTTPEQLRDLYGWLKSLPASLNVEITGEWRWQGNIQKADEERQGESSMIKVNSDDHD